MKIIVFQSDKGDCLLLEGRGGGLVLADGGMPDTYTKHVSPYLNKLRNKKKKLDAVYVSHIDEDHISGVLQMMDDAVAWRIYDYQTTVAKNGSAKKPTSFRPPDVDRVWHNAFHEQVEKNAGDIEDMLAATVAVLAGGTDHFIKMAQFHQEVATSVRQAISLSRRLGEKQLKISLNPESKGKLMQLRSGKALAPIKIGSMEWRIIGPMPTDLTELRKEWNEWLEENKKVVSGIQEKSKKTENLLGNNLPAEVNGIVGLAALQAEHLGSDLLNRIGAKPKKKVLGTRKKVTVPNLASLMFYVEEKDATGKTRTVLMTGDGHCDDILKGLERIKKIKKKTGTLHVDVLKGPHHFSEHNSNEEFYKRIIADHYIACANGAHENPDLDVIKAILASRLDPAHQGTHENVNKPFKLWFNNNSSNPESLDVDRAHMKKVEDLVANAVATNKKQVRAFFLENSSFEIAL